VTGFLVGLFAAVLWLVVMVALGMGARGSPGSPLKSIRKFGALRRALGRDVAPGERVAAAPGGAGGQGHARVIDLTDRRLNRPRKPEAPRPAGRSYIIDLTRGEPRVIEPIEEPDDPELATLLASVRIGTRQSQPSSRGAGAASPRAGQQRRSPNGSLRGHPLPDGGRRPAPTYLPRRVPPPATRASNGVPAASSPLFGLSVTSRREPSRSTRRGSPTIVVDEEGRPKFE
jgi:hypothetical protein